jgi:hypothetical protein
LKDLTNIIIPHFEKYYLLTQKAADFLLFKEVVLLMNNKSHLSYEGLIKIVSIRATINLGLSEVHKSEFFNLKPVPRPIINTTLIPDPQWLSGFVSGEGCFFIHIHKAKSQKIGHQIQLIFRIYQYDRDKKLLELILRYLDCGKIYKQSKGNVIEIRVTKLSDITNIIIPFFDKIPIHGVKQKDYLDRCSVAKLMIEGKHLTTEGLELIHTIKSRMNTGRKLTKI